MVQYGLVSSGFGQVQVAGSYETQGSISCWEITEQLSDWHFLKKNSTTPQSQLYQRSMFLGHSVLHVPLFVHILSQFQIGSKSTNLSEWLSYSVLLSMGPQVDDLMLLKPQVTLWPEPPLFTFITKCFVTLCIHIALIQCGYLVISPV